MIARSRAALRKAVGFAAVPLLATILLAAVSVAFVSVVSAQTPQLQIAELECDASPEVITISNEGTEAQDISGWSLTSDPAASETFDLSAVGSLPPKASVFIQSGSGASGAFVWSSSEIFRDGDATDYARILNQHGQVVDELRCAASPAPTGVDLPNGGGPPVTGGQSISVMAFLLAAGGFFAVAIISLTAFFAIPSGSGPSGAVAWSTGKRGANLRDAGGAPVRAGQSTPVMAFALNVGALFIVGVFLFAAFFAARQDDSRLT